MVTGRKAFRAESHAAIAGAILATHPDPLVTIDPTVPMALDHLVRVCLAKDPARRWQAAADVARQLEWMQAERGTARSPIAPHAWSAVRWHVLWGLAGLAAGAAIIVLWPGIDAEPSRSVGPSGRFDIRLPPGSQMVGPPAISRDGRRIAYGASDENGAVRLHLRHIDRIEPAILPGTDGGRNPFFSPDGQSLGFFGPGGLMKMSLPAGTPTIIWPNSARQAIARGASWGLDGTIVFAPSQNAGLSRVPEAGGSAEMFTTPAADRDEVGHLWPEQLPGGRAVIFTTTGQNEAEPFKLCLHSSDTSGHREIVDVGRGARYVASGHLVYGAANSLMAVPFDLRSLRLTGKPAPIVERLRGDRTLGSALFGVSDSGSLVYAEGPEIVRHSTPVWIGSDGASTPLQNVARDALHYDATASPTGEQVAFSVVRGPRQDLWVHDIGRSTWTRLTTAPAVHMAPVWIAERGRIVFSSTGETQRPVLNPCRRLRRAGSVVQELIRQVRDVMVAHHEAARIPGDFAIDAIRYLAARPVGCSKGERFSQQPVS